MRTGSRRAAYPRSRRASAEPSLASMSQSSYDLPGGARAATGRTVSSCLSRLTVTSKAGEAASFCRIATYSCGADRLVASRATNPIASTPATRDAAIAAARQRRCCAQARQHRRFRAPRTTRLECAPRSRAEGRAAVRSPAWPRRAAPSAPPMRRSPRRVRARAIAAPPASPARSRRACRAHIRLQRSRRLAKWSCRETVPELRKTAMEPGLDRRHGPPEALRERLAA